MNASQLLTINYVFGKHEEVWRLADQGLPAPGQDQLREANTSQLQEFATACWPRVGLQKQERNIVHVSEAKLVLFLNHLPPEEQARSS